MNWYRLAQSNNADIEAFRNNLRGKYPGVEIYLYQQGEDVLYLQELRVPEDMRGQGIGSSIIRDVQLFAQESGLTILLGPSPEKGKKGALDRFYRGHGFVNNSGRNMDFELSSPFGKTMYWRPK